MNLDEIPPTMEQSFKAAIKLKCELPPDIKMRSTPSIELSTLAEYVYGKTRKASQNTDIDMREFSRIDKGLQSELTNNGSILRQFNESIKK